MMSSTASRSSGAGGAGGPMVSRRVGSSQGSSLPSAHRARGVGGEGPTPRLKPSVRQTIESMVSTGSQSEYFRPEQTIILFDWDDTLCPSNWIRENRPMLSFFKPAPSDEKYQKPLRELQAHVEAVLKLAMKMGKVIIVTNAMEPWVETSCRHFLPLLLPIVMQIPVIYARSVFDLHSCDPSKSKAAARPPPPGRALPGLYGSGGQNKLASYNMRVAMQADEMAPQKWKELAFEQEITGFYSRYSHQSWKNIVSIGDSVFERDATQQVVMQRPSTKKACRAKTVKMFDDPTIEELIAQVRLLGDLLGALVQYDGDLNIEIDMGDLQEAGLLDPA